MVDHFARTEIPRTFMNPMQVIPTPMPFIARSPPVPFAVPGSLVTATPTEHPAPTARPTLYEIPGQASVQLALKQWLEEIVPRDAAVGGRAWRTRTEQSGLTNHEASAMNSKFSRLRKLYTYIQGRAAQMDSNEQVTADVLEGERQAQKRSMSKWTTHIIQVMDTPEWAAAQALVVAAAAAALPTADPAQVHTAEPPAGTLEPAAAAM